jgi:ABC-type branched-subunit amino acid transport system substrate-binding protein
LATGLALVLALVACGNSSNDTGTSTAPSDGTVTTAQPADTSTTVAATDGETIKIGSINAIGTQFNNDPARVAAVEAAALAINEEGGINGHELEVLFCNNGNDPNQGIACAQELIEAGVIACVGCENDFNGGDVAQVFHDAGVPMVEAEAIYPEEFSLPTSYLTTGSANYQIAGTPLLAKELLGAQTYAFVGQDIPFSVTYNEEITIVANALGMEEIEATYLPLDASNYDPYAARLAEVNADVILMIASPFQNIPLIKAIEGQGYHPTYIFNADVPRNSDFKEYGDAEDRIYVVGDVPPVSSADENAQIAEYVEQLEHYRETTGDTEGTSLDDSRMSSIRVWLATQFIQELLMKMDGEVTAATLIESLDAAEGLESEMIPPWTPSQEGCFEKYPRVSNPTIRFLRLMNQELVEADPSSYDVNEYLCS